MLNFLIPNPINLLLFTCLLLFQRPIKAQPYKVSFCDDPSNYTSSSQFETNLHLLLSSLASNTAPSGFYNATVGENPNQIDGLAQCRGDVAAQICSDCLNTSAVAILQSCPYKKDATIRFDNCLLRYSDQRIFSVLDTGYWWYFASGPNVSDLDVFDAQLSSLLRNLSSAAASDASKFKTDVSGFTDFSNIYGLVQCTQDLSDGDCLSCFAYLISQIPTCCSRKPRVRIQTPSCYMRYETYPFFQTQPQPPPPPLSLLRPEGRVRDGNEDSSRSVFIILIPVIVTLVLFSAISICLLWRKKVKKAGGTNVGNREDIANLESLLFDLDTLRAATINFSDAKKLGEGGFGPVYKGELSDGQEIAVKRLALTSSQGLEELKNEVALVAKLQHRNLVRLLGCCLQEPEKLLVYAYVPNGSLDKVLFDKVKRFTLDWDRRYKIINGIARGLLYLHEDSQLRIIHRDLKASNILLDGEMNAKISDFGLARLFGGDQTEDNTSRIAGTFGYMAPEYIMHGQISRKSDVYSFGVLILEIVTGRKTSDFQESECPADLLSYIWHHWNQGTTLELLDHSVDSCPENEVLRCIHMGLLCVQEDPAVRPTMSAVVLMLNSFTITPPTPSAPAFIVRKSREGDEDEDEDGT